MEASTVTSGLFLSSLKLNSKGVIVLVIPTSSLPREDSLCAPPPSFFWGASKLARGARERGVGGWGRQFIKAPLLNPQSELACLLPRDQQSEWPRRFITDPAPLLPHS